jgi:acyl carrier protein
MSVVMQEIKEILGEVLQIGSKVNSFDATTALVGNVPEFDSMAVIGVITAIEERYGFTIGDDEIDGEIFETLGSLVSFVERKLGKR